MHTYMHKKEATRGAVGSARPRRKSERPKATCVSNVLGGFIYSSISCLYLYIHFNTYIYEYIYGEKASARILARRMFGRGLLDRSCINTYIYIYICMYVCIYIYIYTHPPRINRG